MNVEDDRALTDELRGAQRLCPGIFLEYEHDIVWHRILHRQGWTVAKYLIEFERGGGGTAAQHSPGQPRQHRAGHFHRR